MAKKTFISYKYDEAQDLRDAIIKKLGEDATYYKGETSDSPDMTNFETDTIRKNLTDMMYHTSVTIVIISPNMRKSKWIDWEIEYCLKEISRKGRTSKTNGVVCIIKKVNGDYSWFKSSVKEPDGCSVSSHKEELVYDIIKKNRYNQNPKQYACRTCKAVNDLSGSYISYIEEDEFLNNPEKYIENAFEKSENVSGYDLTKQK